MMHRSFRMFAVAALLLTFAVAGAQGPLPAPVAADRGAHAVPAPFFVPSGHATSVRGPAFTVTTTEDEDDGTCDQTGTGLSLREALTVCGPTAYYTVFVPSGTYTLESAIQPAFSGLALIGENPLSTTIESAPIVRVGVDLLLDFVVHDMPVTIMNLTFRNGFNPFGSGGAIAFDGYGTVSFTNVAFEDNVAASGGALSFETDGDPFVVSISYATFTDNEAAADGGAIAIDSSDTNANSFWIQNSVFLNNQAALDSCLDGGGAIYAYFGDGPGDSVVIDSSAFLSNGIASVGCDGGAVHIDSDFGFVGINVSYTDFIGNTAPGGLGGAIYTDNEYGIHNISSSYFEDNTAGSGGAVYDADSYLFNADLNIFAYNTAAANGGAIVLNSEYSANITLSLFIDNDAGGLGGALYTSTEPTYIADSAITGNTAGDESGLGGSGGGIYVYEYGVTLHRTQLEDNHAEFGPDCYTENNSDIGAVRSLGGVGVTSTLDCLYVAHPTDQFDNLLINGGFEQPYDDSNRAANNKIPAGWNVRNAAGDKRQCNGNKLITHYGECAFVFKAGGNTSLTQIADHGVLTLAAGDELALFAEGRGTAGSKIVLKATATYTDGQFAKSKAKLTLSGLDKDAWSAPGETPSFLLEDGGVEKLQVKIVDKSASGKAYLDRVYLYRIAEETRGSSPAVLPPPAAPDGFRGTN